VVHGDNRPLRTSRALVGWLQHRHPPNAAASTTAGCMLDRAACTWPKRRRMGEMVLRL
jgi:hypothetical protein